MQHTCIDCALLFAYSENVYLTFHRLTFKSNRMRQMLSLHGQMVYLWSPDVYVVPEAL